MESRGRNGGIGVDIGCGGARESSRQSGRTERKLAASQSARGASLTAPTRTFPSNTTSRRRAAGTIALLFVACLACVLQLVGLFAPLHCDSIAPARAIWPRELHRGAGRQSYSCQPRVASRCTHRGTASSIANGCLEYFITLSRYRYQPPTSILRRNCYTHASASLPRTGKQCPRRVQRD
jgi:hypothetical protein